MRESCSCGAAVQTLSYRRVVTWRLTHYHDTDHDITELSTETSIPTGFTIPDEDDE